MWLEIILYTFGYSILDIWLNKLHVKGIYYILHAFTNLFIIYECTSGVIKCYTQFTNDVEYPLPYQSIYTTIGLHNYHILFYKNKFTIDEWLHHILMIGCIIPLILSINKGGLIIQHAMFYITGLPGFINYLLLFMNRNHFYITKNM